MAIGFYSITRFLQTLSRRPLERSHLPRLVVHHWNTKLHFAKKSIPHLPRMPTLEIRFSPGFQCITLISSPGSSCSDWLTSMTMRVCVRTTSTTTPATPPRGSRLALGALFVNFANEASVRRRCRHAYGPLCAAGWCWNGRAASSQEPLLPTITLYMVISLPYMMGTHDCYDAGYSSITSSRSLLQVEQAYIAKLQSQSLAKPSIQYLHSSATFCKLTH